jgi:hypothetical protein
LTTTIYAGTRCEFNSLSIESERSVLLSIGVLHHGQSSLSLQGMLLSKNHLNRVRGTRSAEKALLINVKLQQTEFLSRESA